MYKKYYQIFFILLLFCVWNQHSFAQNEEIDSLPNSAFLPDDETQEQDVDDIDNDGERATEEQAKILNLSILTNTDDLKNQTLYVGQYITISYRLYLLNDARIVYTEFQPSLEQKAKQNSLNIELVKEGEWQKDGDSYVISHTFKILNTKATIPSLVVHVQNNFLQDSMQTDSISILAQSLQGHDSYCGVVASSLKVVDYALENYDESNNMILIKIEGIQSNLEDFRLPTIKDQEFGQGTKFSNDIARANILARIPKNLANVSFSYFDINKRDFITLSIPNVINMAAFDDDIKEDLNPKNSFLRITNVALIAILVILLLITIIKRSYVSAILSCILVGILVYRIFANTYSIKTIPNARVLIQPTHTSTELQIIPNPTKLEAIDKKNGYYKVIIPPDSKVGWISKTETNKK